MSDKCPQSPEVAEPTEEKREENVPKKSAKKEKAAPKFRLDRFIVEKFVKNDKIQWAREVKVALRLIKKYPEPGFWDWLPVKFMLDTLIQIDTARARNLLKIRHAQWKERLELQKRVVIIEKEQPKIDDQIYGEQKIFEVKPKSIVEFLK